jgi:hypothetical protein
MSHEPFPLVSWSGTRHTRQHELKARGGCDWWLEDTEGTEGRLLEGFTVTGG